MSIASKLQKILDSKAAIKTAINGKGGTITDSTPLDEYADAIDGLPTGGGNTLFEQLVSRTISGYIDLREYPEITKIGSSCFRYCTGLTGIYIPEGLQWPGGPVQGAGNAFEGCTSLTSVRLPNDITRLSSYMFSGCTNLASIDIPDSCTNYGGETFSFTAITTFTVKSVCTYKSISICKYCTHLETFYHHSPSVSIANYECDGCTSLRFVHITAMGSSIGLVAFRNCPIETFIIEKPTPPTLDNRAFENVPATMRIYVPDASLNAYKTATNWSARASQIYPLSDYQP